MANISLEQALYQHSEPGQYRLRGHSPGFHGGWLARAEQLCADFGEPPGLVFSNCVFAYPFVKKHVAIVQVAMPNPQSGKLAFRVLSVPLAVYAGMIGDPFQVAEHLAVDWNASGELPALSWPDDQAA